MINRLFILLIGITFIGCSIDEIKTDNTEVALSNEKIEVDTTLQEYITLVQQNDYSIPEYMRIGDKIGRINTGVEKLEFLKVVYNKDSSNIDLNLLVGYAFLFTYEYEGHSDEKKKERAKEILDYTLNMDDNFTTFSEKRINIEQLKRFRDFWNKSNTEVKENLLTWALLMHFDMDSDLYKKEIENKW